MTRHAMNTPTLSSKAREVAMLRPYRSKPAATVLESPTLTFRLTAFPVMPRSITSLSSGVTLFRSSASIRWMGLRPTTPRSVPPSASTSTRMPGRMAASTPPKAAMDRKPSSET